MYSFFKKTFYSILSVFRILFFSKFNPDILRLKSNNKKCYLLGNGPSINKDLLNNHDSLKQSELIVVNFFAQSELFQQLKPKYYVLADPIFFSDTFKEDMRDKVIDFFNELRDNVTWNLFLLIPYEGYDYIKPFLHSNSNIHIVRYNKIISSKTFLWLDRIIHNYQLAIFSGMNVINVASYLAIVMGFKEINLLGVDHSWFQNYTIGDGNTIYINDKHFYEKTKDNIYPVYEINHKTKQIYKLHELLLCQVVVLETYHMIEEYAKYKNIKIYNRCSSSCIDAFERK